jgi:hypothetical protein
MDVPGVVKGADWPLPEYPATKMNSDEWCTSSLTALTGHGVAFSV